MSYECEIVQREAQPVLSVRGRTPVSSIQEFIGQAYGAIMQHLGAQGQYPVGAPFVAYYNMDMEDLDVEAGFPVSEGIQGTDKVNAGKIPGGRYAVTVHVGPYDQLHSAYNAITEWIQEQNLAPSGVVYEYYLNDPAETSPAEVQSRIEFTLA